MDYNLACSYICKHAHHSAGKQMTTPNGSGQRHSGSRGSLENGRVLQNGALRHDEYDQLVSQIPRSKSFGDALTNDATKPVNGVCSRNGTNHELTSRLHAHKVASEHNRESRYMSGTTSEKHQTVKNGFTTGRKQPQGPQVPKSFSHGHLSGVVTQRNARSKNATLNLQVINQPSKVVGHDCQMRCAAWRCGFLSYITSWLKL